MRTVPPYLLPRPPMDLDAETAAAFDRVFDEAVDNGPERPLDYRLPAPLWQFICYLTDTRDVVVHGSSDRSIPKFEPRKADDVQEFGNRAAVYGASDGLWAMYYAILDRPRFPMTLHNAAARIELGDGTLSPPHYFFSISSPALAARAFAAGSVYVLPRDSFEPMPVQTVGGLRVHTPQWASPTPVVSMLRIDVEPEDFPFLGAIRGHDDETLFARARANPEGFPWIDAGEMS